MLYWLGFYLYGYFQENAKSESQLSLLTALPNVDTEKLLRLKNRIVSKQSENTINSTPVFSGYQEFYRDFILVAANHIFNRHLNDALISDVIDLNNTKFSSDFDENGKFCYLLLKVFLM